MRIALCGPATLSMLQDHLDEPVRLQGYPFPLLPILTEELIRRGHDVAVVSTSPGIASPVFLRGPNLTVGVAPSRGRARDRALDLFRVERRGIASILSTVRPDVIHAHWTYEFALGALASRDAPTLVTAHDAPLTVLRHFRDPYRLVRTAIAYRARMGTENLTAVSPYLAERWRREMLYGRPIRVIPNPAPETNLRSTAVSTGPVILDIADASPRKNLRALIVAFQKIRVAFPTAQLRLVGGGLGPTDEMAGWANGIGAADGVRFLGPLARPQVATELANATLFAHPSLEESQGMSILEAMRADLPVVAGERSGAIPWTLMDGRAGTLVDVRDPQRLADAIIHVIRGATVRELNGERLQRAVESRFGLDRVVGDYLAEYERLVRPARTA